MKTAEISTYSGDLKDTKSNQTVALEIFLVNGQRKQYSYWFVILRVEL